MKITGGSSFKKENLLRTVQGEAEAFSIEAKAKAEADQMSRKAMAYKEYNEAALIDMLMTSLPQVIKSGLTS